MKNMSCFDYEATGTNELGTEGMDQHTVASVLFTTLVDSIKFPLADKHATLVASVDLRSVIIVFLACLLCIFKQIDQIF